MRNWTIQSAHIRSRWSTYWWNWGWKRCLILWVWAFPSIIGLTSRRNRATSTGFERHGMGEISKGSESLLNVMMREAMASSKELSASALSGSWWRCSIPCGGMLKKHFGKQPILITPLDVKIKISKAGIYSHPLRNNHIKYGLTQTSTSFIYWRRTTTKAYN